MTSEERTEERTRPVAVVDDDAAVLDSLKVLLETTGHRVAVYASAAAFLDDGGTEPACLILDHHMPEMTGLELAARLRKAGVSVPVLLITGVHSLTIAARAAELGIERVLEKPLDEGDLLSFVTAHY
ncbi:MAG: response regulator transcription factor [Acetobacteraceae bacterium]